MTQKRLVIVMNDGSELRLPKEYKHAEAVQTKAALERLLITENLVIPRIQTVQQPQVVFRQDIKAIDIRDA